MSVTRRSTLQPIAWALSALFTLIAAGEDATAVTLPFQTNVQLNAFLNSQTFTVDLGTLPPRPILVVEASSATDPGELIRLVATNWDLDGGHPGPICYGPSAVLEESAFGPTTLKAFLIQCDPQIGALTGESVDVTVSMPSLDIFTNFSATVTLTIRGETRPPTATLVQEVDTALGYRMERITASKDTVLYEDDLDASNGAGEFLWLGERFDGPFPLQRFRRHALLAFDVNGKVPPPPYALLDLTAIEFEVTGTVGPGGPVSVHRLLPGNAVTWVEGSANAIGSEFFGISSPFAAADWDERERGREFWGAPGGDTDSSVLATDMVSGGETGVWQLSSPAFVEAVFEMWLGEADDDESGFLLTGPSAGLESNAIQIASRENNQGFAAPVLLVGYDQTAVYESGLVSTNVVNFISEGQNFRWIYDHDQDGVFVTPVQGICEVTNTSNPQSLPYTYRFQGQPGYTGVDCCTWRIESPQTGTVGTGQALFFHNIVPTQANMPLDSDTDGIKDLCDNCPTKPNGPLLGTCRIGTPLGGLCRSDLECGGGGKCSLSQEDSNGDFLGNVCVVPEPSLAGALASGIGIIAALSRARGRGGARR